MSTDPVPNVVLEMPKRKRVRQNNSANPTTDAALARLFINEHGHGLRFDPIASIWYTFDGAIWRPDRTDRTSTLLLDTLTRAGIGSAKKLQAAKRLAQLDERIIAPTNAWNADAYLLGTPRGVVDLKAGTMLPPSPHHMVSLSTAVTPEHGEPSTWLRFLDDATRGDGSYVRYLQQLCGYLLTASVHIEGFWFLYGDGGGGKGTFMDTLAASLGDYGWKAASRTLLSSKAERHLAEIASFQGRRLVYISETPTGREWDMARLKELTGGDPINANFMSRNPINFQPTHKLVAMGNHAPAVPQIDNSVRRRFHILPFDNIVPEAKRDPTLKARLKAELPYILAWAIVGARDVIAHGFSAPEVVRAASEAYFSNQDGFSEWLAEKCYRGPQHEETSSTLLASWNRYRKDRGEDGETYRTFAERLERGGFVRVKKSQAWWQGPALNDGGRI